MVKYNPPPLSTPLSTKDLESIEFRASSGQQWKPRECEIRVDETDGWMYIVDETDGWMYIPECASVGGTAIQLTGHYEGYQDDWLFVAHAREDIRALLVEVRRLKDKYEPEVKTQ